MRLGPMRERVEVQSHTANNAFGEVVETYAPEFTAWTRPIESGGREFERISKVSADVSMIFKIRYREGIKPDWRAIFKGRTFDIKSATNPDGYRRWLLLQCVEHVQ